jgi:hypothetical protein
MGVHLGVVNSFFHTLSHSQKCECDSQVVLLTRTFSRLCFGRKPKVRVMTWTMCLDFFLIFFIKESHWLTIYKCLWNIGYFTIKARIFCTWNLLCFFPLVPILIMFILFYFTFFASLIQSPPLVIYFEAIRAKQKRKKDPNKGEWNL